MSRTSRQIIERRIWRLSFLITGNELAAADLVDRVLWTHDVKGIEPAKLDRLVVQQAREMLGTDYGPARKAQRKPLTSPLVQRAAAPVARGFSVVQSLPEQPREAWMLMKIDEVDELHASRAMDCSKTATMNHFAAGEARVREELGDDYDSTVAALRAFADSLDPEPIIRQRRASRRKQRVRRTGIIAVLILAALLIGALAVLKGWVA